MDMTWTGNLVGMSISLWRELEWIDCTDFHEPLPLKDELMAAFLADVRLGRQNLEPMLAGLVGSLAESAATLAKGQEVELVAVGIIHSFLKSLFKQGVIRCGGRPSTIRAVERCRILTRYRRFGDRTFEQAGVGQKVPSIGQQLAGKNIFNMEHLDERTNTNN